MSSFIRSMLRGPEGWRQFYRDTRDRWQFEQLPRAVCDTHALAPLSAVNLTEVFSSPSSNRDWPEAERRLAEVGISNRDGSNSGDSRAVYYLVRYLQARSVLEIGTRLGATTARIALALHSAPTNEKPSLVTVDIDDVNASAVWSGSNRYSPRESVERLGCGSSVTFVAQNSLDYFARDNTARFDLIFLDGSHDPGVVYQEVPRALKGLQPGGYILLHDYYPLMRPLWEGAEPITGPYLAIRRLQREGALLQVLPFGNLPWWTRSNSSATSLALLGIV